MAVSCANEGLGGYVSVADGLWGNQAGLYRNYNPKLLVDLVARVLALVPPWVRIYRIQRDIPMPLVTSGVDKGNLRELALARMSELGLRCRDVRTREVGIQVAPCQVLVAFLKTSGAAGLQHAALHLRH